MLIVGGRQVEAIAEAINGYCKGELLQEEMVEDIEDLNKYKEVKYVVILDAGLHSIKNWEPVKELSKKLSQAQVYLYTRFPDLTPKKETLGDNIDITTEDTNSISISNIAKRLREFE